MTIEVLTVQERKLLLSSLKHSVKDIRTKRIAHTRNNALTDKDSHAHKAFHTMSNTLELYHKLIDDVSKA